MLFGTVAGFHGSHGNGYYWILFTPDSGAGPVCTTTGGGSCFNTLQVLLTKPTTVSGSTTTCLRSPVKTPRPSNLTWNPTVPLSLCRRFRPGISAEVPLFLNTKEAKRRSVTPQLSGNKRNNREGGTEPLMSWNTFPSSYLQRVVGINISRASVDAVSANLRRAFDAF